MGGRITTWGVPKVRRLVQVAGEYLGRDVGVHNNTLANLVRAVVERVLAYRTPEGLLPVPPCSADVGARLSRYSEALDTQSRVVTPWTVEKFLSTYTGRRRTVYSQAAESILSDPLSPVDAVVRPAFVKAEKIDFSSKPDPAPRVIQPRQPRYNLEVGRYLKKIEPKLFKAIQKAYGSDTPVVLKGLTMHGVAQALRTKWESFTHPVCIGLDASRFDQHVRREMLRWEHKRYLAWFRGSDRRRLKRLLSWQLQNKCVGRASDGMIRYEVDGCRMSGDMNTSLGNCLIMTGLVYTYARERGVKVELGNNGDDCVVIMEAVDQDRFLHDIGPWFLEFGFRMAVEEPVHIFEQVVFCQTQPVFDGDRWVMCRDYRKAIPKDTTALDPSYASGRGFATWASAVSLCGQAAAGGIPILDAFYKSLYCGVEKANHASITGGLLWTSQGMHRGGRGVTDAARVSFWEAFGADPTLQRGYEQLYGGAKLDIPPVTGYAIHAQTNYRGRLAL